MLHQRVILLLVILATAEGGWQLAVLGGAAEARSFDRFRLCSVPTSLPRDIIRAAIARPGTVKV